MVILITGASGFFGSKLFSVLVRTYDVAGTTFSQKKRSKQYLDITNKEEVLTFFERLRPEVVVHTAAISNADMAETNPDEVHRINVVGTENIVAACKQYGSKLIFLSSDYIFAGDQEESYEENDTPNPVNTYGKQKVEAEQLVQQVPNSLIIRPTILYGFNDKSKKETFVEKVLTALRAGKTIEADHVIKKYPLLIDDFAQIIKQLIEEKATGILHVGSQQAVTRYEWACIIADTYGLDKNLIKPVTAQHPATKPANVYFSSQKLLSNFSVSLTDIEQGMKIYKAQEGCMFRMIYSVKPTQAVLGHNASLFRVSVGKQLAKEAPAEADIVVPVPESGMYGAMGYSEATGIPFYYAVSRDHYTRKTLFESNKGLRSQLLREKLLFTPELIKDKRIVVVDEAILSGTTLIFVIGKLKEHGAKEIHVRIPSPPMRYNCNFKVLDPNADLLAKSFKQEKDYAIYKEQFETKLTKDFDVDSVRFLTLDGFLSCLDSNIQPCVACFR